jgi:VCBS repeat-containing protein
MMRNKLLSILALVVLVTSTLVGCSGAPSDYSTLTIFSITQGDVFVMKAGTDEWTEATAEMPLGVGDIIKTGDDSGAEITFFDGSTIELEADTRIEITSLDSSPDNNTKTITLMQTIGTTISRVTKLLDPASSYAIETPTGVAAVRGSTMIVRIIRDDPNYGDVTVLVTSVEGDIRFILHGEELQLPEGAQVIADSETAQIVQLSLAVDDSVTTDEDTAITVAAPGVLGNDSGLVVGDTLTLTSVDTAGTLGTVTCSADGSFTYDPNGQFEDLEAGDSAADSFAYTMTDDYGITDAATVTITINGVDDSPPYTPPAYYPPPYYPPVNHPPVALDDAATTDEDNPISVAAPGVLINDSDPDIGDTLTVTTVNTIGTLGAVSWSADGAYTYDPDGQFEYLGVESSATDSFIYVVSDGHGGTDTATVTITINGVDDTPGNRPPTAENDGATTDEDNPVTVTAPGVLDNDSDPDGDILAVTSVDTIGTIGAVSWSADGAYTYDPDGQFEYLQAGSSATDTFTYTVSDGNGATDTATVTITISGVNDPPVATDDSDTTPQGTPVTIDILSNDSDPDGDVLTLDSAGPAGNGSVTNNGNDVTYMPYQSFIGIDTFTYTISDGHGGTDTATVTVTVTAIVAEATATIRITVDEGPTAPVYVQDTTSGAMVVDGNEEAPVTIAVVGGHSYCVWVEGDVTRYVGSCPKSWSGVDTEAACGTAEAGGNYPVHFTQH